MADFWCRFIGRIRNMAFRVSLMIVAVTILMLGMSILVDGLAIPATFIVLVYAIILTSVSVSGMNAERGLTLGVFGAWLVNMTGLIAPFEKFVLPGSELFFPTILGIFAMVYLTLLAMEYVTATLRLRLTLEQSGPGYSSITGRISHSIPYGTGFVQYPHSGIAHFGFQPDCISCG